MKKIQIPSVRILHVQSTDIICTSSQQRASVSAGKMTEDNTYDESIWN